MSTRFNGWVENATKQNVKSTFESLLKRPKPNRQSLMRAHRGDCSLPGAPPWTSSHDSTKNVFADLEVKSIISLEVSDLEAFDDQTRSRIGSMSNVGAALPWLLHQIDDPKVQFPGKCTFKDKGEVADRADAGAPGVGTHVPFIVDWDTRIPPTVLTSDELVEFYKVLAMLTMMCYNLHVDSVKPLLATVLGRPHLHQMEKVSCQVVLQDRRLVCKSVMEIQHAHWQNRTINMLTMHQACSIEASREDTCAHINLIQISSRHPI